MKYCFVIPVYNHPHYLNALVEHLEHYQLPIIMVNDGSDVECSDLLRKIAQEHSCVDLIEHSQNLGKGQAVITGIQHAYKLGFSHAIQLDSDGQHRWDDISKFLEASQQNPEAMIIGQPEFDDSVPKKRLYGRYATHIWVWIFSSECWSKCIDVLESHSKCFTIELTRYCKVCWLVEEVL